MISMCTNYMYFISWGSFVYTIMMCTLHVYYPMSFYYCGLWMSPVLDFPANLNFESFKWLHPCAINRIKPYSFSNVPDQMHGYNLCNNESLNIYI